MTAVLVVDDLPDWRNTISRILQLGGYEVYAAGNQAEALQIAEHNPLAAAVLDIRLVDDDDTNEEGLELATRLRQQFPDLVVLFLTGYITDEMVAYALSPVEHEATAQVPGNDFLEKSEINTLTERLRLALDRR